MTDTSVAACHNYAGSSCCAIVVVQHAAQAPPALDLTYVAEMARLWADQLVRQTLVIALAVVVLHKVLNCRSQRLSFSEISP